MLVAKKPAGEQSDVKTEQDAIGFEGFHTGEVYNDSGCKQVHVKPEQCNNDIEISLTAWAVFVLRRFHWLFDLCRLMTRLTAVLPTPDSSKRCIGEANTTHQLCGGLSFC